MSFTVNSTNMLLPVPTVGLEAGPQYATDINNCLTIIDQHNHSSGSGVQISPSGMDINADLLMNSNNLTLTRSVRFANQPSTLVGAFDLGCLYETLNDLYYNDGIGNIIRITQSGGIAGTPGSIANLVSPASAAYSSGLSTFIWQSNANTPANMDAGSLILRNIVANSFGLTLDPPAAMGANYTLTLPTLPVAQNIMTLDSLGQMAAPWNVDNSSIIVSSNLLTVGPLGIITSMIGNNAVTRPKLAAVGEQISSSSGLYAGTSSTYTDVTNLSVTITTTGRPVMLMLQSDGAGTPAFISSFIPSGGGTNADGDINYVRDATVISEQNVRSSGSSFTLPNLTIPASSHTFLDTPAAGTYTYKVQVKKNNGNTEIRVGYAKLVAYEL